MTRDKARAQPPPLRGKGAPRDSRPRRHGAAMTTFEVRARFLGPSVPRPRDGRPVRSRASVRGLAEPFRRHRTRPGGLVTRSSRLASRVSTDEILERAKRFSRRRSRPRRAAAAILDLDSDEWRKWCNFPQPRLFPARGARSWHVTAAETRPGARRLGIGPHREGSTTARERNAAQRDPRRGHGAKEELASGSTVAILRRSRGEGPWGFQFEGHHIP